MNDKKLLELKQKIEDKKSSISELKGKRSVTLDNLKKNWNCLSLEQASKLLEKLRMEIEDLKNKKESGIRKLLKQYKL